MATGRVAGDATSFKSPNSLVALYGELDLATLEDVEAALSEAEGEDATGIIVDLGGLRFIDATGIGFLIDATWRLADEGRHLSLLPGPAAVQRVFALCGLTAQLSFSG